MRQVEGVREEKKPYSVPTVDVLRRVCKTVDDWGENVGLMKAEGQRAYVEPTES